MGEKIRSFLNGAGTVIQIMPSSPRLVMKPDFMRASDAQRLGSDWQRVGHHLARAISAATDEKATSHGSAK
jgi:hypothetical protein